MIDLQSALADLPEIPRATLTDFVTQAASVLDTDLASIVLFGSGAEGRLRLLSDLNVVLVLKRFDASRVARVEETLRSARAAVQLDVMFLLEDEIASGAEFFAVKFADLQRRHRVLWGADPFGALAVDPKALAARLQQVLLNLVLRTRALYAYRSGHPAELAEALADLAGPYRTSASTLLTLEGRPGIAPKEALQSLATSVPGSAASLEALSAVREGRDVTEDGVSAALRLLLDLGQAMLQRAQALKA